MWSRNLVSEAPTRMESMSVARVSRPSASAAYQLSNVGAKGLPMKAAGQHCREQESRQHGAAVEPVMRFEHPRDQARRDDDFGRIRERQNRCEPPAVAAQNVGAEVGQPCRRDQCPPMRFGVAQDDCERDRIRQPDRRNSIIAAREGDPGPGERKYRECRQHHVVASKCRRVAAVIRIGNPDPTMG